MVGVNVGSGVGVGSDVGVGSGVGVGSDVGVGVGVGQGFSTEHSIQLLKIVPVTVCVGNGPSGSGPEWKV